MVGAERGLGGGRGRCGQQACGAILLMPSGGYYGPVDNSDPSVTPPRSPPWAGGGDPAAGWRG